MKKVIWKTIQGYSRYKVSNKGKIVTLEKRILTSNGIIKNLKSKNKKLRAHPKSGFLMTDLIDDNNQNRTVYVHKIVAQNFISNPTPRKRKLVTHIDDDKNNNKIDNLVWTSHQESIQKRFEQSDAKQRKKQGPRPPLSKEQEIQALKMKKEQNMTLRSIARELGCSASYVLKVIKNNKVD